MLLYAAVAANIPISNNFFIAGFPRKFVESVAGNFLKAKDIHLQRSFFLAVNCQTKFCKTGFNQMKGITLSIIGILFIIVCNYDLKSAIIVAWQRIKIRILR